MKPYYVQNRAKGEPDGPYAVEELKTLRLAGKITDNDQVARDGDTAWRTVGDVLASRLSDPPILKRPTLPALPSMNGHVSDMPSMQSPNSAGEIRVKHLKREGWLKWFGYAWLGIGTLTLGIEAYGYARAIRYWGMIQVCGLILILTARGMQIWAGWLLKSLRPEARWSATGAIILLTLLVVLETLGGESPGLFVIFGPWLLYLIHTKKGRFVLSPEYEEVIAATPEISTHGTVMSLFKKRGPAS